MHETHVVHAGVDEAGRFQLGGELGRRTYMHAQADLVEVQHTLCQVFNYKGAD